MDEKLKAIYDGIIEGDHKAVAANVKAALDAGLEPGAVLNESMVAAMAEVGRLFEEGEYFVPEMLISARAMKEGLGVLRPMLAQNDIRPVAKVAIGTVKGDLHDIGKNLVAMMLEGAAFEILDLGSDVSAEKFVDSVKSQGANIIAMSALLTTTMVNMKGVIEALSTAGLRDQVKVIVGGAPVTDSFAKQIGADGYAADASRAVNLAKSLVA
jgi:5-methyltetrahydrofolate--homocysteine methyltransferase